jgi:regulatory protein
VDEDVEKAKNNAFRLLARRAYTCKEIRQKLRGRGTPGEVVNETMAILERLGLVDDREFARRWVRERMRLRPMGPRLLERDLRRRGVGEDLLQQAVQEVLDETDLDAVAVELLRSRAGRYQGLERNKAWSRMYGFLARRGFDPAAAREAVGTVWGEVEAGQG